MQVRDQFYKGNAKRFVFTFDEDKLFKM